MQVAIWEARLAGIDGRAEEMFDRLREVAERRGFAYIEAGDLARGPISEILTRVAAINDSPSVE
ncbi:hypothetical protein [Pacificibacter marinus]|uniref:Uncharacterized protein n=1 Tax=Pacificibacter marinus TaxID=658057 RepID=A0A1Y5TMR8_9RHOB|nr:hypothetical protein [Pacificibacter marinus]SEK54825.1 hypothetical protein SAMN04488032_103266 [Pacificibacter marinus]SLN67636.1 hypothetical protein PAM7971_03581 [Pacificibacter marinus]